jgi:CHAT domain-containing protein/lipoprotein NlpI
MKKHQDGPCLEDKDFYSYLAGPLEEKRRLDIEAHLSACPHCRKELSGLIRILNPESEEQTESKQEASPQEIQNILAFLQKTSRKESNRKRFYQWGAIAAAVLIVIGLGGAGFFYLYVGTKSRTLCDQARSYLQQVYEPRSPSDFRLSLPFKPDAAQRAHFDNEESFAKAAGFFNQAIGVRKGMKEALLGLGYIDLREKHFSRAEQKFQTVLDVQPSNLQALLARGVSRLEEGLASNDPAEFSKGLEDALRDFESVLRRDPGSVEARYNKIQALYNSGRHKEALQDIEAYLSYDSDSIWAAKIRDLKIRIQMNRSELFKEEIDRAAERHDAYALETVVRIEPGKISAAVMDLCKRSLAIDDKKDSEGAPDSNDLRWAAESLASLYRKSSGDAGSTRLFQFYAGLSPPQRLLKKRLDARLEELVRIFDGSDFQSPLRTSESLIRNFEGINDYWQLARVYQLRGSCCFYGKTDFPAATEEFLKMLKFAERTADPNLIAKSLGAIASSYAEQHLYDDAFAILFRMKELADRHHMYSWSAFASNIIANIFRRLGQLEESRQWYLSTLRLANRLMDQDIILQSLENLAVIFEQMGHYAEASNFYSRSEHRLRTFLNEGTLPMDPKTEARRLNLLSKQGYLALKMKKNTVAKGYFEEALKNSLNGMHELEARNRLGLAQVYIDERMFGKAETELQAAQDWALTNSYPEILWQTRTLKAFILEQDGDLAGAIENYRKATDVIEKMRGNVSSLDLRQSYFFQRFDPYRRIVSLLYRSNNDPRQAMKYADRAKGFTLWEYLALHSGPSGPEKPQPISMRNTELFGPLPSNIAVLEYFLSVDEILIFVTGSGETTAVSVRMSSSKLQELARRYVESIQANDSASFDMLSRSLYEKLITPALPVLESSKHDTLVILPDGPLHRIPFNSLKDSRGRCLLERFAISYAPSRTVLNHCLIRSGHRRINRDSSIILMDGSSNLPGAAEELAHLSNLYFRNRLWKPGDFHSIAEEIENYELIHFSGHARLYRGKPRLLFYTPEGKTYLDSSDIQHWNLKNSLLVALAGCNTGIGPILDGEAPWGLIPAFLKAGASCILVSLFPVDDIATTGLTLRFYETLTQGSLSRAQSLRRAQLAQLNMAKSPQEPLSWCPFVLIGDPR